jgi:hypothetical protein
MKAASSSAETRHDLGRHYLVSFDVAAIVTVDQQLHADILVSRDQIDRLY